MALRGIEKYQLNPLRAARLLAHLHAALHDAWDACSPPTGNERCAQIAQHVAASQVLEYFFPGETPGRFKALARSALAGLSWRGDRAPDSLAADHGWRAGWGAIHRASNDRADRALAAPGRPAPTPGTWRPTPPLYALNPTEQGAPNWQPWLLRSADEVQPPAPLAYGSPQYAAQVMEVLEVNRNLSGEQKRIADEWNLDLGTATPAGVWNRHGVRLIAKFDLDLSSATQLLTALNLAMADAFIACWHVKMRWWTERPITEVRERLDPHFVPYIVTPPFPGYVSGHATASGAAAAAITALLPAAGKEVRALAEEAALSRLYGGIHFRHDNDEGLRLGLEVGRLTVVRLGHAVPIQSTKR